MIRAYEEDQQIAWACAAQSPDLLPERFKQKTKTSKVIRAAFEDLNGT